MIRDATERIAEEPGAHAMERFEVRTSAREQMVDITRQVAAAVDALGLVDGAAIVFVPHTTAGVTINENADPDVVTDLLDGLERIAPRRGHYRHAEGNSDGHIKATLVGASQLIPVSGRQLVLGTWQGVYFCEFDGPRTRNVIVQVLHA